MRYTYCICFEYTLLSIEIEKVDVFRKVLNMRFIKKFRAVFIVNETQL